MSNARNHAKKSSVSEDPPTQHPEDHRDNIPKVDLLSDYRGALADLTASQEKLTTLRGLEASLRADADGVANAKEKLLSDSVTSGDEDETVEELSRLRSRAELFERKIADVNGRVADAEQELTSTMTVVASRSMILWRAWLSSTIEREKSRLLESMVEGIDTLSLERCALFSKAVAAVRSLEPLGTDAQSVGEALKKLLAAIPADFVPPPFHPPATVSSVAGATPKPRLYGPYLFHGLTQNEIDAEVLRIRTQDPSLDMAGSIEKLAELHPELFISEAEMLAQNESLIQPGSGVSWTKAPMIGDTFEPTEEQFSHA